MNKVVIRECLAFFFLFGSFSAHAEAVSDRAKSQASAEQIATASERIEESIATGAVESPGRVVVVYFTPSNIPPAANHIERIRRITEETASFYQRELARHGFADRIMNVLRNDDGEVEIIDVVGAGQGGDYGKPDGNKIRNEVVPVLRQRGIDPNASVILLFCNLMDYDPVRSTISHHSPYYGGGSHLSGTAWQCDSEILDPLRFQDPTPIRDGEYGNITIGKHNSIFIGGVIHELGHALSLPHCRQREDEAVRGTALMGSGNRTYGENLRGEGRGTFLTQTHALRLAAHPAFNLKMTNQLKQRSTADWTDLKIDVADNQFIRIRGIVRGSIPFHSVVAYLDPDGGSDYDATTASAVPNEGGRVEMQSGRLRAGANGELRLVVCHVSGANTTRRFAYRVDATGTPDLSSVRLSLELAPMIDALRNSDIASAEQQLSEIAANDVELQAIGNHVLDRFRDPEPLETIDVEQIDASIETMPLSRIRPESARVGWQRPTYNAVPNRERLLAIDGDFFASGVYAHAPAKHAYRLNRKWDLLIGRCGVQDGNPGKVDFEIIGDGRLLWESRRIGAGQGGRYEIDVSNINELSLVVNEGSEGNNGDWGVWIEPVLSRDTESP